MQSTLKAKLAALFDKNIQYEIPQKIRLDAWWLVVIPRDMANHPPAFPRHGPRRRTIHDFLSTVPGHEHESKPERAGIKPMPAPAAP
jgi:hypothetical protein